MFEAENRLDDDDEDEDEDEEDEEESEEEDDEKPPDIIATQPHAIKVYFWKNSPKRGPMDLSQLVMGRVSYRDARIFLRGV